MTDRSDVEQWIAAGEGESQEFKATTGQRTEAARTLCALLNHRGGRVIFGVSDDRELVGQQVGVQTLTDVRAVFDDFDPATTPRIEQVLLGRDRSAVVVTVDQGRQRPYRHRGKAYKRVGSSTVQMTPEEHDRLLLERLHSGERWELEASPVGMNDLDLDEILATMDEAARRGRASPPLDRNPNSILRSLGVLRGEFVTHAAVVLFGREEDLLANYSQVVLKLAHFDGTEKTAPLLDERELRAGAFEMLRRVEQSIRDALPVAATFDPDEFQRKDEPRVPMLAIREALANAIAHRDYHSGAGSVSVFIFSDRLEVTSTGPLHFDITVLDLYQEHESRPWNPIIGNVLYRRGVVDRLGTGTNRMVAESRAAGLPTPEITDIGGSIRVTFLYPGTLPTNARDRDLSETAQAVLVELTRAEPAALGDLVAALPDLTDRQVRRALQQLREQGLAEPKGLTKAARWQLVR